MMPTESFQPVQLKGEIMDLEFTIDTDHRSVAFSAPPGIIILLADLLTVCSPLRPKSFP